MRERQEDETRAARTFRRTDLKHASEEFGLWLCVCFSPCACAHGDGRRQHRQREAERRETYTGQVEELTAEMQVARTTETALEATLQRLRQDKTDLTNELVQSKAMYSYLKTDTDGIEATVVELSDVNAALEQTKIELAAQVTDGESKLAELAKEAKVTQGRLAEALDAARTEGAARLIECEADVRESCRLQLPGLGFRLQLPGPGFWGCRQ